MTGVFEGVGSLQFSPDNKYAYIYSGAATITSGSYTTGLDFKTNSEYILAEYQISALDSSGSDLYYKIFMNNVEIIAQFNNNAFQTYPYGMSPFKFVIPPFSHIVIQAQRGSGSDYAVYHLVTGKVGGAIEQQNLEAITNNNKWASK